MNLYVLKCKNCGKWRVLEVKRILTARFRCFDCNKRFAVKLKGQLGLALLYEGPYGSGAFAAERCAKLNARGKR